MSNTLVTRERNGGAGTLLGRPFGELWGLDPFRNFMNTMNGFNGMEVGRTDTGYTVEIPVAGFTPEQIDVTLEDGVLTVSGRNEKRQFSRSITVPEDIDDERIEARVEHGMLTLTLTLLPKAQPKKIAVKSQ
jgi:HSP20 family molecular chaperone IbpA